MASVHGKDLPISTKQSIEICNFIRGRDLQKAKDIMEKVINFKIAVPYRRFNKDTGHKKRRVGAGRYPIKACKEILRLLESLEVNAQNKGLDTASLFISSIIPNKGAKVMRYGRKRAVMKLTHIKITAEERVKKKEGKKETKPEAKKETKPEVKKEEKKTEVKEEKQEVKKPKETKKPEAKND